MLLIVGISLFANQVKASSDFQKLVKASTGEDVTEGTAKVFMHNKNNLEEFKEVKLKTKKVDAEKYVAEKKANKTKAQIIADGNK